MVQRNETTSSSDGEICPTTACLDCSLREVSCSRRKVSGRGSGAASVGQNTLQVMALAAERSVTTVMSMVLCKANLFRFCRIF